MTRVALVHEWIDATGGSEQVFEEMAQVFPEADLWALWNNVPNRRDGRSVTESWLARTPLRGRKALALPFMPLVWHSLSRTAVYDVVVGSSHCMAHGARFPASPAATYLAYVHSPMRYVWSPELDPRGGSMVSRLMASPLKAVDRRLMRDVARVAVNSHEVRRRVEQFWDREAAVIYPPVDTDFFAPTSPTSDLPFPSYVLGVGRFIPYKRFDVIIAAAAVAGVPLVIAGSGPDEAALREQALTCGVPVAFETQPTRERLRELYTGADALLFPVHEDFGIVPVEAMACGVPIVGLARGGLLETVEHGTTGWLVEDPTPTALARGLLETPALAGPHLRQSALRFSRPRFHAEFAAWVDGSERVAEARQS